MDKDQSKYMSEPGDLQANCIVRRWTDVAQKPEGPNNGIPIKIMHWNMLAQRLCDAFDKINDDAPILTWENRERLYK